MKRANNEGSIYKDKRRGVYVAALTIGYCKKTGRQIRRTKHARTKAQALEALQTLRKEYQGYTSPEKANTKLIDYIMTYYETHKKTSIRYSSSINYKSYIKTASKLPIANRPLRTLTPSDIQAAINNITAQHTKRHVFALLRAALRQAVFDNILQNDLTAGLRLPPLQKKARQFETISPAEAKKLIETAENPIMQMSIKILYSTGLRPEEMLALRWQDIDIKKALLSVNGAVNPTEGGGAAISRTKTGGSIRTISIPMLLVNDLSNYAKWQRQYIMQNRLKYNTTAGLIISRDGKPWPQKSYYYYFKKAAARAAVGITPKSLRHNHATQLFAAGWTAKDVQTRLGHSSIKITMDIYTHYIAERGENVAEYVNSIYAGIV